MIMINVVLVYKFWKPTIVHEEFCIFHVATFDTPSLLIPATAVAVRRI